MTVIEFKPDLVALLREPIQRGDCEEITRITNEYYARLEKTQDKQAAPSAISRQTAQPKSCAQPQSATSERQKNTGQVLGMNDRQFMALFAFAAFGAVSLVGCIFYGVYWVTQHVHVVVR